MHGWGEGEIAMYEHVNGKELNLCKRFAWFECLITDLPNITSPASNTSYVVPQGSNIALDCQAVGDPPPQINWYQGGELLTEGVVISAATMAEGSGTVEEFGPVLQLVSGSLTLSPATTDDNGVYSCLARNAAGNVSVDVRLTVTGTTLFKQYSYCYFRVVNCLSEGSIFAQDNKMFDIICCHLLLLWLLCNTCLFFKYSNIYVCLYICVHACVCIYICITEWSPANMFGKEGRLLYKSM